MAETGESGNICRDIEVSIHVLGVAVFSRQQVYVSKYNVLTSAWYNADRIINIMGNFE